MNKNFRKALISTICLLIVGILSLTGVTYAWFTASQTAQVNGIEVSIASADGGIMLDGGDGNWTFNLDAIDANDSVTSKVPVSTVKALNADKKLDFFVGTIQDADNTKEITTEADTVGNYFFTEFRMKNPNTTAATVKISASVTASKNAVKNAVRWAIVDKDTGDVYFFAGNSADNLTGTEDYFGVKGASATAFDSTVAGDNVATVALNEHGDFVVTVNPVVVNDDGTEGELNARSFALYAWMEGNDSDCVNALSGSTFGVNLSFNTELADA